LPQWCKYDWTQRIFFVFVAAVSYATASIKSSHFEGLAPEPVAVAPVLPWELESVTLTKREHVELVNQRNYWKSSHQRALGRLQWAEQCRLTEWGRAAQELAALRAQMLQAEERHRQVLEHAGQVELALRGELEVTNARIRDLRKRHFARKSERTRAGNEAAAVDGAATYRARGQQSGAPGHGRTCQDHLPTVVQTIGLEASCLQCGLGPKPFPGTQDCEVLEIEVRAYRRIIRRQRYKPCCGCGCLPVTATATAHLLILLLQQFV